MSDQTSDRPAVSPLRQRMIEDMTIRQFGEQTQRDYVRQVREFAAFLGRSPDQGRNRRISGATSSVWRRSARAMPGSTWRARPCGSSST